MQERDQKLLECTGRNALGEKNCLDPLQWALLRSHRNEIALSALYLSLLGLCATTSKAFAQRSEVWKNREGRLSLERVRASIVFVLFAPLLAFLSSLISLLYDSITTPSVFPRTSTLTCTHRKASKTEHGLSSH